ARLHERDAAGDVPPRGRPRRLGADGRLVPEAPRLAPGGGPRAAAAGPAARSAASEDAGEEEGEDPLTGPEVAGGVHLDGDRCAGGVDPDAAEAARLVALLECGDLVAPVAAP